MFREGGDKKKGGRIMVKFQKQLEGQLVPEWRNAYLNYKQLKQDVKQIRNHIARQNQRHINTGHSPSPHRENFLIIHHHHKLEPVSDDGGVCEEDMYESELVAGASIPWERHDEVFFATLDSQLNMVNRFYRTKEREFALRGKQLEGQLDTFVHVRRTNSTCKLDEHSSDHEEDPDIENGVNEDHEDENHDGECKVSSMRTKDAFDVNRNKIGHAKKMLCAAYIEYYKGLTLLQNYSSLNTLAFAKILKKYDKVTGKNVMDTYLRYVQSSYFSANSHKVIGLMKKVENLFTKHFSENNRRQALGCLRPSPKQNSNGKIFSLGLFLGCSWGLMLALVLALSQPNIVNYLKSSRFKIIIVPIFSTLILLLFHIYMYGLNVYFWRRTRINYAFIFELEPSTELRCLEIMNISTCLLTIIISCMLLHLVMVTKGPPFTRGDVIPITILLILLVFVIWPFDVCYKSTRFYFLQSLRRIICAPFYKVEFIDFFLADQFTSQIIVLRNLQYMFCYYVTYIFKKGDNSICSDNPFIQNFQHIIALLPYLWRLMQCVRRWMDEKDILQIANGGKYISALVAMLIRFTYERSCTKLCLAIYIISSTIATIYQLYWDIVMDWGLLQRKSINPWLRDQLILKNKTPYYISMGVNALLRLAWLYAIIHEVVQFGSIDHTYTNFIFGMVEIARRGLWNFYRLENEHLNNVGKFRAVKTLPLPFNNLDQNA